MISIKWWSKVFNKFYYCKNNREIYLLAAKKNTIVFCLIFMFVCLFCSFFFVFKLVFVRKFQWDQKCSITFIHVYRHQLDFLDFVFISLWNMFSQPARDIHKHPLARIHPQRSAASTNCAHFFRMCIARKIKISPRFDAFSALARPAIRRQIKWCIHTAIKRASAFVFSI